MPLSSPHGVVGVTLPLPYLFFSLGSGFDSCVIPSFLPFVYLIADVKEIIHHEAIIL